MKGERKEEERNENKRKTEIQEKSSTHYLLHTRVYPEVSGLATWSENCKWYRSLPLCAVLSLFCESV
jgi:hypothetical protein